MIVLAWHTARARAASLTGTFVALALGVTLVSAVLLALVSTVGGAHPPRWFTTPDVVVTGQDTVTVVSGSGDDREVNVIRAADARTVPASLVGPLSALGAAEVTDYAAYASAPGVPGDTFHPWSAASLHHYTWVSGTPPLAAGQVVLTAPTSLKPGDRVTAQTADGPRPFTVSGVIRTAAPPAFYGTAAEAGRLAGNRVNAIALTAKGGNESTLAAQVSSVTSGHAVQVLTGDQRGAAEPDPDADLLDGTAALLGTTAGLAGFVSVFVVAGTFAYAVAVRRREFGLLRAGGARPRQVRRLVLGEALAVGVVASLAGSLLGIVVAGPAARWLAGVGFAPAGFTAHFLWWPALVAFAAGLLIALSGAWLASRRAAKVRPAEALREAAVDTRVMPVSRWVVGLASLGGAVPLLMVLAKTHSTDAAALFMPVSLLLTLGFAMLTPVLARPLIRLLTPALSRLAGPSGLLAGHAAASGTRRTAATVAPILLTLGIAGSLIAGVDTLGRTQQDAAASRITAQAMVTPAGQAQPGAAQSQEPGLADATVTALAKSPGIAAAVPVTDTTVYLNDGDSPDDWTGQYVPGPELASVQRLPVVAGSLAALTGTGTVAVPAGSGRLGQQVTLWLADSTQVRLRVVAVIAAQLDTDGTVLLPWALRAGHVPSRLASAVYLRFAPGTTAVPAAARAAASAGGGTVTGTAGYLSAAGAEQDRMNRLALIAVLGLAIAYTGIAIANTLVMANAARKNEFAALRLSGATKGQLLRMIALEAALVSGLAMVLAAAVVAATAVGLHAALAAVAPVVHLVIPWPPLALIALGCLVTALLASLAPVALALRRGPVELARALE